MFYLSHNNLAIVSTFLTDAFDVSETTLMVLPWSIKIITLNNLISRD
jgi:hypothetical protein